MKMEKKQLRKLKELTQSRGNCVFFEVFMRTLGYSNHHHPVESVG